VKLDVHPSIPTVVLTAQCIACVTHTAGRYHEQRRRTFSKP